MINKIISRQLKIKAPPDNINELCSYNKELDKTTTALIDLEGCNKVCVTGKCCLLDDNNIGNCRTMHNEDVCVLYQTPCSHLPIHLLNIDLFSNKYHDENDNNAVEEIVKITPLPPNSLSTICSSSFEKDEESIDSNNEMRDTCDSLCSVALCCIVDNNNDYHNTENGDNNCAKDNEETCKECIKYCYNIWFDDYYINTQNSWHYPNVIWFI